MYSAGLYCSIAETSGSQQLYGDELEAARDSLEFQMISPWSASIMESIGRG